MNDNIPQDRISYTRPLEDYYQEIKKELRDYLRFLNQGHMFLTAKMNACQETEFGDSDFEKFLNNRIAQYKMFYDEYKANMPEGTDFGYLDGKAKSRIFVPIAQEVFEQYDLGDMYSEEEDGTNGE